jgi:hypothetical protein
MQISCSQRGLCTALVLSGFGLSAFFYSSLSHILFPGKTGDYLLLLSLGSSLTFLLGFFLVRIIPPESDHSSHAPSLSRSNSHAVLSGDEDEERPAKPAYIRRRTSSDIGGRAWAYSAREESSEEDDNDAEHDRPASAEAEERQGLLQRQSQEGEGRHSQPNGKSSKGKAGNDLTGWKLVKNADFIVLFIIMTLISGTGLLVINVSFSIEGNGDLLRCVFAKIHIIPLCCRTLEQ